MALNVGELVARLTLDDDRFTRSLRNDEQALQGLARTADQATSRVETSFEGAATSAAKLDTAAKGAERQLDRTGTQGAKSLKDTGAAADKAEKDVRKLRESSEDAAKATGKIGDGVQEKLASAFSGVGDLAGQSGASSGGNFLAGFSGKIGSLGGKGGPIFASLAGVAAIGLAAGAVLANAIADGMEQEKQQDLIQAKLGINEETARRIGQAAGAAYSNGWGESVVANMDGLRAAIQAGVLTGEEDTTVFASTAEQLNIVADLMGEEVPAVARAAGQAIKNGLAKDGSGAFDLLAAAQRNSLNVSEDLLDSFNEYSTQLRSLGLDGVEGWALVSQGVKGGARDTDVVIDALKEFKLRASDGTAAAAEGFDKLKVPASEVREEMTKGGDAARDMMARLLRGLQEIKDPQDRYNAALALFGTKFEDIQDAAYELNLDTALQEFGAVEGAARQAGDTMSSNTASSFESAKRSIETSSADIKLALAEAFGPALTDVANWVTEHKPEIIGFFTGLADAGFATVDAMLAAGSGILRAWANTAGGVMELTGGMIEGLGGFSEKLGGIVKHIPGMESVGLALEQGGKAAQWYGEKTAGLRDEALGMADAMDSGRVRLQGMRDGVREAGEQAENSARLMQALGAAVVLDVPDSKSIVISDNSPEAVERLKGLGFQVEHTPNGIRVTATTSEAQTMVDAFYNQNNGKSMTVYVDPVVRSQRYQDNLNTDIANGGYVHYAAGGIEDHQAQIGNGRTRIWNEPETGGESYIPLAPSKRARSEAILRETARRFGLGVVRFGRDQLSEIFMGDPKSLTNRTDPTGWRALLGGDFNGKLSRFGIEEDSPLATAVLSARKAIVDGDFDGQLSKFGIEEDSPIARALLGLNRNVVQFANGGIFDGDAAVAKAKAHNGEPYVYGGRDCSGYLSEVFNAGTGQSVRFVTGSDFEAMGWEPGYDPNGFSIGTDKGVGENGHMAGSLFGVNIESDGSNGVQYGGGADGPLDFPYVYHWPGASRPSYDRGQLDSEITKALAEESSAATPEARERAAQRRQTLEAQRDGVSGVTDSGVSLATDGQRVFVTNWPSGLGASLPARSGGSSPSSGVSYSGGGGTLSTAREAAGDGEEATLTPRPITDYLNPEDMFWQFAEGMGISKPGGMVGALMDAGKEPENVKALEQIAETLRVIAEDPPTQVVFQVKDIDEGIRQWNTYINGKSLSWTK
ncbi:hypothetical protein GS463_27640 [Rhodococcus hoagii]|nr:hypothetical protein [Prescottella equi]